MKFRYSSTDAKLYVETEAGDFRELYLPDQSAAQIAAFLESCGMTPEDAAPLADSFRDAFLASLRPSPFAEMP